MFTRKQMKQAAKLNMRKNNTQSIIISLIAALLGASLWGNPNFTYSSSSGSNTDALTSFDIERFLTPRILIVLGCGVLFSVLYSVFVVPILKCGLIRYFLRYRGDIPGDWKNLFEVYREKDWLNIAAVTFFTNLSVVLWTLLFIIPGIVKAFQYAMVPYILSQNPSISSTRAKQLSREMMKGHCCELFVFGLSFLGWIFLTAASCFLVGIFYVFPYMNAAYIEFYSVLRAEAIKSGITGPDELPAYGNDWYGPGLAPENGFYGSAGAPASGFTSPDVQPQNTPYPPANGSPYPNQPQNEPYTPANGFNYPDVQGAQPQSAPQPYTPNQGEINNSPESPESDS